MTDTDTDTELEQARAAVLDHGYVANEYPITFEQHGDPKMDAVLRRFEQAVRDDQYAFVIAALIPQQTSCGGGWAGAYVEAGEPCPSAHVCLGWVEDAFHLRELEGQP